MIEVRGGKPCFVSTGITVYEPPEYPAGGITADQIVADHPDLARPHIRAAPESTPAPTRRTGETLDDKNLSRSRLGWNGERRDLDLSKHNVSVLSRALERYWAAGRPVAGEGEAGRQRKPRMARSGHPVRDPKAIRAWALANGVEVPARGRIPADVERQFNEATGAA